MDYLEELNLETITNAEMLTPTHGNIIPPDGDLYSQTALRNPKIAAAMEIAQRTLAAIDTKQQISSRLWASQALQNATEIGDETAAIRIMKLIDTPAEQGGFNLSQKAREDLLEQVEPCLRNGAIRAERHKKMIPEDYQRRMVMRSTSRNNIRSAEEILDMWKNVAGRVQTFKAEGKAHSPLARLSSIARNIGKPTT